ncbi:MAG: hypothetical protein AAGC61_01895 [Microbacterium sp.]
MLSRATPTPTLLDEALRTLAIGADVLTVAAFAIAAWGVFAIYRSRPAVRVWAMQTDGSAVQIMIDHQRGTDPIHDVLFAKGLINSYGTLTTWDGGGDWVQVIGPMQQIVVDIFDPSHPIRNSQLRPHEYRHEVSKSDGFLLAISWRHPLVRWRRQNRLILWTATARASGVAPQILAGSAAKKIWKSSGLDKTYPRWSVIGGR